METKHHINVKRRDGRLLKSCASLEPPIPDGWPFIKDDLRGIGQSRKKLHVKKGKARLTTEKQVCGTSAPAPVCINAHQLIYTGLVRETFKRDIINIKP